VYCTVPVHQLSLRRRRRSYMASSLAHHLWSDLYDGLSPQSPSHQPPMNWRQRRLSQRGGTSPTTTASAPAAGWPLAVAARSRGRPDQRSSPTTENNFHHAQSSRGPMMSPALRAVPWVGRQSDWCPVTACRSHSGRMPGWTVHTAMYTVDTLTAITFL